MRRLLIVAVAIFAISCGGENKDVSTQESAQQQLLENLKQQYGASSSWYESLDAVKPGWSDNRSYGDLPYSYHADEAIKRQNGKPILFVVSLNDIVRDDSGYTAHFYSDYYHASICSELLILRSTTEQVDYLSQSQGDYVYVVVASVTRFERPKLMLRGRVEDDEYDVWSELYIEPNNDVAILYGNLIYARKL